MFVNLLPVACPALPEELWLEILRYTSSEDLWLSIRHVNKRFQALAEDVVQSQTTPNFTICLNYTLGSGTHHRWYDVRARVTLGFSSICKHNPQYALFDKITILPESCHERAWEKWNQISAGGLGNEVEWRIRLGTDGELKTVRMLKLVTSSKGAWCDWRELLDAYFRPSCNTDPVKRVQWLNM
ncbi:hypothetical protein AC578_9202 [Pseudocercospora eumusae]|uniref:F-box domain-containing protein n=1 Tax=Pseudocercospora eumusae TaxID=321146 RepID=A0A139HV55_9PEZI|nr:hypothetical protein AC578_9202 [Pseudocercospora eumusae]